MAFNIPHAIQIPVRRKGDHKCSVHRNKELLIHCSDCDELICIKCSISIHNGHRQEELLDIIPQRKSLLQDYINDTENKTLVHLKKEIGSVENKLNGNETKVDDLPPQMKDQEDFDILTEEFSSIQLRGKNRDVLIKYKDELEDRLSNLEEKMKMCKQVLQSGTAVQVYDETSNIHVDTSKLPLEPVLRENDFHLCTSTPDQLLDNLTTSSLLKESDISANHHGTDTQSLLDNLPSKVLTSGVSLQGKSLDQMLLIDSEVIANKRSRRNAVHIAPPYHQT
ncbi:uncharacterized protein DDB_G0279899-like [Pecten maximus]|uniref:uncharacterized protein DDB_G0279899-like n=1 Tax=Pecten maximus TaxID=6579 RepID=UPI001458F98C|nr:uncharacterized protein DDB_G0279899-like [Pecten maximus]